MSNNHLKQAISLIFSFFSFCQPALADQTYTRINSQNLEPSISCDQTFINSLFEHERITVTSNYWEEAWENYNDKLVVTRDDGGISISGGIPATNVVPKLYGDAFVLDERSGIYALILPSLENEPCAITFHSADRPQWAERVCVSNPRTEEGPLFPEISKCPMGNDISRFSLFYSNVIRGFYYFPSPVNYDSYKIDEYSLIFFQKFSTACEYRYMIEPGIVGVKFSDSPFVSILFKTADGKNAAIFADQCSVTISAE